MGWFSELCRNTGLMIHNIKHPDKAVTNDNVERQIVSEKVEQQQISEQVTLRRTTIEEIEVRSDKDSEG